MNTYEMIYNLLERGVMLPNGLAFDAQYDPIEGCYEIVWMFGYGKKVRMDSTLAYNLIAMHFAQCMEGTDIGGDAGDTPEFCRRWDELMGAGNGEGAIKVLWEATQ